MENISYNIYRLCCWCNLLAAAPQRMQLSANPALRSVPGTEYRRIVNGRYFPCLFSITSRRVVAATATAAAAPSLSSSSSLSPTCRRWNMHRYDKARYRTRCNGKFCAIARREYFSTVSVSLSKERDFPWETPESIRVVRFRFSDLSSSRADEQAQGWLVEW